MGRRLEAKVLRSHRENGKGSQSEGKNISRGKKLQTKLLFFFGWLILCLFFFFLQEQEIPSHKDLETNCKFYSSWPTSPGTAYSGCYQDPFQLRREPLKRADILVEGWKLKDENLH